MDQTLTLLAALEALRNQHQHLEETIGRLVALMQGLPEGKVRNGLLDEISAVDVIAEVMRRALDSVPPSADQVSGVHPQPDCVLVYEILEANRDQGVR
jgi:hypothetical protein